MIDRFTLLFLGSFLDEPLSATAVGCLLMGIGAVCGAAFWFGWEQAHKVGKLGRLSSAIGKENARLVIAAVCLLLVLVGLGIASGLIEKGALKQP